MNKVLCELFEDRPVLEMCREDILAAFELLVSSYRAGGKVLVCGNGGSASDAEHICGELLKCFRKARPVPEDVASKLDPSLVEKLEGSLPAVSLVSMSGIISAFANDVAWETVYAQQVTSLLAAVVVVVAIVYISLRFPKKQ
jgi:D-sedoheptulose 7-phosphate isomerase